MMSNARLNDMGSLMPEAPTSSFSLACMKAFSSGDNQLASSGKSGMRKKNINAHTQVKTPSS